MSSPERSPQAVETQDAALSMVPPSMVTDVGSQSQASQYAAVVQLFNENHKFRMISVVLNASNEQAMTTTHRHVRDLMARKDLVANLCGLFITIEVGVGTVQRVSEG